MSINPLLLPIEKDTETIRKTVLTTIIKMLTYRKWLKQEKLDENIIKIISINSDDNLYKIKLDNYTNDSVIIKLLPQKVTGLNKSSIILDFIKTYKKEHKILVIDDITDKAKQQLQNMPSMEVFNESFLMLNLVDYVSSPQYEILTSDESAEFLESYHVKKNKLPIIFNNDPAALYLYVKKGDILRIIRNSEITGKSIGYRIVVNKFDIKL